MSLHAFHRVFQVHPHVMSWELREAMDVWWKMDFKKSRWVCKMALQTPRYEELEVSEIGVFKNSGTPKWMIYNGKPN